MQPCLDVLKNFLDLQERFDHHCAVSSYLFLGSLSQSQSPELIVLLQQNVAGSSTLAVLLNVLFVCNSVICTMQVVGNCVAQNNHRFFVAMLIFGQVGCLLLTAGASWKLKHMGFPM